MPRGDRGWRVLAPVGCSATDPSSPKLSCSCPQLGVSPGQGTALVNPSPFSHHKGEKKKKKSPWKAAVGWSWRGGGEEGAVARFSPGCSKIHASSHQLGFVLPPNSR